MARFPTALGCWLVLQACVVATDSMHMCFLQERYCIQLCTPMNQVMKLTTERMRHLDSETGCLRTLWVFFIFDPGSFCQQSPFVGAERVSSGAGEDVRSSGSCCEFAPAMQGNRKVHNGVLRGLDVGGIDGGQIAPRCYSSIDLAIFTRSFLNHFFHRL